MIKQRIAVGGYQGRLGQALCHAIQADPGAELSVVTSRIPASIQGCLSGKPDNFPDDFDVFIDFTRPEATAAHVARCSALSKPIVIGTTGLSEADKQVIARAASHIPVLLSDNMSIGVQVLRKVLSEIAPALGQTFDIDLVETHRIGKQDTPSGTALMLAETLRAAAAKTPNIHSLRTAEVPGEHRVIFTSQAERLVLEHTAFSRELFALGAIKAAKWLYTQTAGLYDMPDVLFK